MSKQNQAAENQSEKAKRSRVEPAVAADLAGDLAGLVQLPGGPVAAAGDGSVAEQAARLGDGRLQTVQRQQLASQIGGLQGNQHLQSVIATLDRKDPAASHEPKNGDGRRVLRITAGQIATRKPTRDRASSADRKATAAEPSEELDVLGMAGPATFAIAEPPPEDNGRNRTGIPFTLQRQEEAAEEDKDKPTEEEKAAALAAAKVAEASAGQSASRGKAEIEKSKTEKTAEKAAGKAAKGRAEQAAGEAKAVTKAPPGKGAAVPPKAEAAPPAKGPATGAEAAVEGPAPGATGAKLEKAPASPEEDPAFQAVVGRVKGTSTQQKGHAPAKAKSAEAQSAAEPPAGEVESKAKAKQVGKMAQAPTPGFDAAAFKAELLKRIEEQAPKSMEEADKFKEEDKLGGIKDQAKGKVAEEKEKSREPVKEASEEAPDSAGIEPKPVTPLKPAEPGAPPPKVGAEGAAPKAKGRGEVEAPIKERTGEIDQTMAEANVTDEQLAKSNEPEFVAALEGKKEAKAHAKEAPKEYRQFEQGQITQAESEAAAVAQEKTQAMHADRAAVLGQVQGQQGEAKTQDQSARAKVTAEIRRIYEETKAKVEKILNELDTKVEKVFDEGATAAKQAFEDYVEAKMEAYKERRYGGWFGWARWLKDKLLGMPSEVNAFYAQGRQLFLKKMDAVIDNVVTIIGRGLTEAKAEIASGKKEVQKYVSGLPADLKQVGQQAARDIQGKFDELEQSVDDKQNELIDTLASKYQEHLQAVDARIEEMKAANEGLVSKVINAVVGIIKTIAKLVALLAKVLAKIAHVVGQIIEDPVGFFGNLLRAIKLGFNNFVKNIKRHLIAGLLQWLTGALGPMGIELPDDIFSLPGIFSLVTQVLGLTWTYIRGKAVKHLGEPVVKALETGYEVFEILVNEGPLGLWKFVQQQFTDLKQMVIDQIQDMVITEVIKAGVKWLVSLFNPVGAFIKAAMAIYELVMFFIEKGGQILELINAVIDGIAAVVGGAIEGAARLIEEALARAVPLIIDLLARLLGISGLVKKVQGVIKKVRKRIDKAIDKIILKAKKAGRKLLRKLGIGKAERKKEETEVSAKVKVQVKKEFSGKKLTDAKQADRLLSNVFNKYRDKGLKGIKYVPDPKKPGAVGVMVNASQPAVIASVETGDTAKLITLAKNFIPYNSRTNLYVFYDADKKPYGGPIKNSGQGHAETRFRNKTFPKLLRRIRKDRKKLKTPEGQPVPVFLEMNRLPCDGCAPLLADLASQHAGELEFDIKASSVSKADWQSIERTSVHSIMAMHQAGIKLDTLKIWGVMKQKLKEAGVKELQLGREYFVNLNQWTGDYESKEDEVRDLLERALQDIEKQPSVGNVPPKGNV